MTNNLVKELKKSIKNDRTYKKSFIYLVGNNALAKGKENEISKKEYELGKYLYEQGIKVPKMYGLIGIRNWDFSKKLYTVMEFLNGNDLKDLTGLEREEAFRQYLEERKKVLELGICPYDSSYGRNAIFHEGEQTRLIDFEDWQWGTPEEIDRYYKKLKDPEKNFR